jgi:hypothetical protein
MSKFRIVGMHMQFQIVNLQIWKANYTLHSVLT